MLLELCLLEEVGFSPEEIKNLTQKRLQFGNHKLIAMNVIPMEEVGLPTENAQDTDSEDVALMDETDTPQSELPHE